MKKLAKKLNHLHMRSECLAYSRLILTFIEFVTREKMPHSSVLSIEAYSKYILVLHINHSFQTRSALDHSTAPSSAFSYLPSIPHSPTNNPTQPNLKRWLSSFNAAPHKNRTSFNGMWDNLQLRTVWHHLLNLENKMSHYQQTAQKGKVICLQKIG